jgi:site-specific DNA recombinase
MKRHGDLVRAAIYARVSSDQQTEAGTIASQVTALEERLRQDGLTLEPEMRFLDDGYSGSTLVRPALERLRDAAADGALDRLYVHSPDRLARNYAYQVLLVDELRRGGVELVFLNRALGRSPEDDLLLQVQGMVAEYERAKILERSRRGKLHTARRGSVNVLAGAPYGYRYVSKLEGAGTARYDVVLEQARVVRQMFEWVGRERCSIGEVCRRLKAQGVPSPKGKETWDRTTVWGVLKNPAYHGTARFGKTRAGQLRPRLRSPRGKPEQPRRAYSLYASGDGGEPVAVPALVSEELFAAVAEQLAENRRHARQRRRGARYLLQGLVVCSRCGYALYGKPVSPASSRGKRRYTYYRCIGTDGYRFGGQKVCANKQVRTDVLEEAVWKDVCVLLNDPEKVAAEYRRRLDNKTNKAEAKREESLGKLVQRVKRGIARLIDAYGEGLLDKEEFEPRIRAAKERLARLQAEAQAQAEAEAQERELRLVIGHLREFAERVRSGLKEADWSTRREIIRALVRRVEVDSEEVRIIYRVTPSPFVEGPQGGLLPDCRRREEAPARRAADRAVRRGRGGRRGGVAAWLLRCGAGGPDRRRAATAGGRRAEAARPAGADRGQPRPGPGTGGSLAGGLAEGAATLGQGSGADGGPVAGGAGGLPLGASGGTAAEEQGEAAGPRSAPAAVGDPHADAAGGPAGGDAGFGGAVAALREGDQELLAGVVRVLRVGGHPADQQRPGASVR